jgi:hypothetical protein
MAVPTKVRLRKKYSAIAPATATANAKRRDELNVDTAYFKNGQPHADIAEIGAEQKRGEALQEEQKAAGRQKLIDRRRAKNGRDNENVHQHAERCDPGDRNGTRQQQRPAKLGIEIVNEIHAAHDEIGIGDPHHINHAENQIKSERQQCQHAA